MAIIPFIYDTKDELLSNTYIVINDKDCLVIDPSSNYDGIINYINKNSLKLKGILITHAHFDHIGGVDRLVNAFKVKVYAHYNELETFKNPYYNCSDNFGVKELIVNAAITTVGENDKLNLANEEIIIIETPYHTAGSVCYYFPKENALFSGDSLFLYGFGRYDLPTSVPKLRKESIDKLMKLNDEIKVYPGHGRFTTIGNERKFIYRHSSVI